MFRTHLTMGGEKLLAMAQQISWSVNVTTGETRMHGIGIPYTCRLYYYYSNIAPFHISNMQMFQDNDVVVIAEYEH